MNLSSLLAGLSDKPPFNASYLYHSILQPLVKSTPDICANLNETTIQIITCAYKDKSIPALTYNACVKAVNSSATWYSGQDVYDRVLLWRVPLLALWATTTLPEIATRLWTSLHTKCFTLIHLIGDPIDTMYSMLYKLDLAQRSVQWSRKQDRRSSSYSFPVPNPVENSSDLNDNGYALVRRHTNVVERTVKEKTRTDLLKDGDPNIRQHYQDVIALLVSAFDEYGVGEEAMEAVRFYFHSGWSDGLREALRQRCATAAFYIASNRVSRFLPSIASIIQFLIQISAPFWKVLSAIPGDTYDPSNPVNEGLNRAPHNIAFGVLFFWLPMVVMMTAWVGGSQTAHLVPRELENLALDARQLFRDQTPKHHLDLIYDVKYFPVIPPGGNWARGGLPVWQIGKFSDSSADNRRKWLFRAFGGGLSVTVVALPTACAISISWLTPSDGFGCRAMTQLTFFLVWIFSAAFDWMVFKSMKWIFPGKHLTLEVRLSRQLDMIYWITFGKDLAVMTGTVITLTFTALGIFNKCDCWSKWISLHSARYISFSQEPYIFQLIKYRLRFMFSYITGGAVLAQVIIFIGIVLWFWDGHTVLTQRDIDAVLEGPSWSSQIRSIMISRTTPPHKIANPDECESTVFESLIPKSDMQLKDEKQPLTLNDVSPEALADKGD